MEFKARKRTLKVTYGDATHEVVFPKVRHVQSFSKKYEELETDSERFDFMLEYLAELGLPRDVSEELETEDVTDIMNILSGAKKK